MRFVREIEVDAPLTDVWDFHATTDGLRRTTPAWMGLTVERVVGPSGDPDPTELRAGSTVELSLRPLGTRALLSWTSQIVERRLDSDTGMFRDEMVDGPFRQWIHTHRFESRGEKTLIRDEVNYELRYGPVTHPLFDRFLRLVFRHRHRRTRAYLEP